MSEIRWAAFRTTPRRFCGHFHKSKKVAEECMRKQEKRYGGKWRVSKVRLWGTMAEGII